MKKIIFTVLFGVLALALFACTSNYEKEYQFTFTFEDDDEGWVTGFADLPADYSQESYELDAGWGPLPTGLSGNAMFLQGHNRSDDLFMFMVKKIEGLKPGANYQIEFNIELASDMPGGMVGIGGSPGESVYVKAGAVNFQPEVSEDSAGELEINVDKGSQSNSGKDMIVLGTIANPNVTEYNGEYALMNLNNQENAFDVKADDQGSIWVIVGTDSGFEGLTRIYYDQVSVSFTEE
jgi:hypothetical protein